MLTKSRSLIYFAFAMLVVVAAYGMNTMAGKARSDSETPIRKIEVSFDEGQHEQFFEQMKAFSDKHGFAIRVAPTTPTGKDFIIEMWREDLKILAVNPFDPGIFKIGIYKNDGQEIPSEYLDKLIDDFEGFSRKVAGAKVNGK